MKTILTDKGFCPKESRADKQLTSKDKASSFTKLEQIISN